LANPAPEKRLPEGTDGLLPDYAQTTGKVWLNGKEILVFPRLRWRNFAAARCR